MPSRSWWARHGRASVPAYRSLQPVSRRAHDRRCPRETVRGKDHPGRLLASRTVDGLLCGESRSGPDPLKLDRRGSHKDLRAARRPCPRASTRRASREPGFQSIRGCARGSYGLQKSPSAPGKASRKRAAQGAPAMARRSGALKRVAFDEAAGDHGPGASSRGGESNPVNPREGARQRASEVGARPSLPAEEAGGRERCSEGL